MSNSTKFRGLMFGVSVLPALLVMPAMAVTEETVQVTENMNINEIVPDGIIHVTSGHAINSISGYTGTLTTENISLVTTAEGQRRAIQAAYAGSGVVLGNENTNSIHIESENDIAVLALDNSDVQLTAKDIDISAHLYGLTAQSGATLVVDGFDFLRVESSADSAILALAGGAKLNITGKDVEIISDSVDYSAVHVGNNTTNVENSDDLATVNIVADNVTIQGNSGGISAMSQGIVNISGNLKMQAEDAIVARGGAQVNINTDGAHTTQMNGNINFNYDEDTSGTPVDAYVNVNLTGAESYWKGNTYVSYGTGTPPDDSYLIVKESSLVMRDGATWIATVIEDDMSGETSGHSYTALNNLNINNGTVNIQDTERGITVDNATVADATFNGGPLNIGTKLDITGGENLFAGDILGDGALNVASGAVMNIGDAIVNLSSITLDGTMIANLTEGSDTAKITADTFTGDGNLSLILDKAGEYNIFGNATFDNVEIDSVLYGIELAEDGKTFTATEKSVAQVAADSNLTVDAAQSVVNLTKSSSDALNDLGVRAQEALAVKDSAAVEHATRAINPETASVAQSVTTSVQNTVANLVAGRMASIAPVGMTGRTGGDTSLTAGGVWAQGLFNKSKSNDLFDGETMGVAAGIDGTIGRDFSIGAGYSFAASDIDASARNTDIDSHTVFVYGQYKPSQWYANAMLNYTMSSYTESGDALGVLIDSEYDIDSFGGQIATGYDFASGITPQIAVRYLHIGGADYTNSLGVASEIADSDYLTGVLGAKYAFDYNPSESVRIRPEVRAAVKYDFLSDNAVSTVTMPGVNAYVISGERLNRLGGEFGLGVTMTYAGVDVSLNYDIEVREDYTSQTGMVRARYNF